MLQQITIRKAKNDDARAVATILRELGWSQQVKSDPFELTVANIAQRLEAVRRSEASTVLVAQSAEGQIVGYLAAHWYLNITRGLEGYVSELFLLPASTGQGIGGSLLHAIQAEAQRRDCKRLMLINRRDRESYQRGFYAKHGWEEWEGAASFVLFPGE